MNATRTGKVSPRSYWTRIVLSLVLVLGILVSLVTPAPLSADNPAPVQLYYVTLPEADGLTVLHAINTAAVTPGVHVLLHRYWRDRHIRLLRPVGRRLCRKHRQSVSG